MHNTICWPSRLNIFVVSESPNPSETHSKPRGHHESDQLNTQRMATREEQDTCINGVDVRHVPDSSLLSARIAGKLPLPPVSD
jgi:hypothetical protein